MERPDVQRADPVYPPARRAAPILQERLTRQQAEAREEGRGGLAPLPGADVLEDLIEAGFWASLQREEGRSPRISLAYAEPEHAGDALVFERPLPLHPRRLTRLAPAVERPGIHLCVWGEPGELYVWGSTRTLPDLSFVLEVVEPGLVVAKINRGPAYGKFGNLAVFEGDRVKIVDDEAARRPDCPELLASLTGLDGSSSSLRDANVLVQLALSMRAHGHGGTLLVVGENESWQRSIVSPVAYGIAPPHSALANLVRSKAEDVAQPDWPDAVRKAVDAMAGLTAVDGATIVTADYEALAFGAKIERAVGSDAVRTVVVLEPVVDHVPQEVSAVELGGTRHLSAAQFVHDQRDALALVASQDGRFTIFAWSTFEDRLHAHRIETLLL